MLITEAKQKLEQINALLADSLPVYHGFLGGSLGLLYYYYYAAEALQDPALFEKAEALLEQVFDDLNDDKALLSGSAFSDGAAGLGYVVSNLIQHNFIDLDVDAVFDDLDGYIFENALSQLANKETDYLHGAMGAFHYFSSREQTPKISHYLNALCSAFCESAVHTTDGIYFVNESLERLAHHNADLGLAHGLSGFLLLLINAWPHVHNKEQAEHVIRSGIAFILKQELPAQAAPDEYAFFPTEIKIDNPEINPMSRLAWCYGDTNQVLLLYRAGKLFGDSYFTDAANRIGMQMVDRKTPESTFSTDAHFCHGSAGLAQFYKCLYRETGNDKYDEAYEYWISETISLVDKEIAAKKYAINPVGILEGWTGIACVLADYISPEPLHWSKAFLL